MQDSHTNYPKIRAKQREEKQRNKKKMRVSGRGNKTLAKKLAEDGKTNNP